MALTKYRLGHFIELRDTRNIDGTLNASHVKGISTDKRLITTKTDLTSVNLENYKIVKSKEFAYVADTSRRGNKISIAFNSMEEDCLVSSISIVFRCKNGLLPEYLFMYFKRPEFDRYARFNSWGSARESFSWEDMCGIEIELPPIEIQQKYVAIYEAIRENQQCYEAGLEDLKLVCDAEANRLIDTMPLTPIASYIHATDERNDGQYNLSNVRGISIDKKFIPTRAKMEGVSLNNYKVVHPQEIAYVPVTSRNGGKITIAQNVTRDTFLVSAAYLTMKCDNTRLLPDYLMLFFTRSEFDRYARFNSWGSARETFDWTEMESVAIPIPSLDIQRSIADLFRTYNERKEINEKLKQQIRNLCPILIKGSLVEANKV